MQNDLTAQDCRKSRKRPQEHWSAGPTEQGTFCPKLDSTRPRGSASTYAGNMLAAQPLGQGTRRLAPRSDRTRTGADRGRSRARAAAHTCISKVRPGRKDNPLVRGTASCDSEAASPCAEANQEQIGREVSDSLP